jgi:uncharacterized protein (TIGR00251 family)
MYIKLKVFPDQKKETFAVVGENRFEVRVRVPAERNLANTRVIELTAEHFGVSVKQVRIISGHHHPSKILSVENGD